MTTRPASRDVADLIAQLTLDEKATLCAGADMWRTKALERLGIPARTGPTVPRLAPFGAYRARDGWVVICAAGYKLLPALAPVIGYPDILEDPRFKTQEARIHNYKELDAIVESWTCQFTAEEAVRCLNESGVAAAVVRSPADAMLDMLLAKKRASDRKSWLEENGNRAEVEV